MRKWHWRLPIALMFWNQVIWCYLVLVTNWQIVIKSEKPIWVVNAEKGGIVNRPHFRKEGLILSEMGTVQEAAFLYGSETSFG